MPQGNRSMSNVSAYIQLFTLVTLRILELEHNYLTKS